MSIGLRRTATKLKYTMDMRGHSLHGPKVDWSDLPPLTQEELDEVERGWIEGCREWLNKRLERLRREGCTVALIDPQPTYTSMLWVDYLNWNWLGDSQTSSAPPASALSGTLGLLTADPDVRLDVIMSTHIGKEAWDDDVRYHSRLKLDRVRLAFSKYVFTGHVQSDHCEMNQATVAFPGDCPQQYADIAAEALRIDIEAEWPLWFYAALRPAEHCHICSRRLSDPVSQALYIGPDCARRLRMEHSERMAKAVMELRWKRTQGGGQHG